MEKVSCGVISLDRQTTLHFHGNIDMLTLSGHKIYAPKGVGTLYLNPEIELNPQIDGGGQEKGLRSGTENVPYIEGLGKACEIARNDVEQAGERIRKLRDHLWGALNEGIQGLALNGHPELRLPNTLNVRFPGVSGNAILANAPEIAASTGSACHADDEAASTVIRAMGLSEEEALGSVRLTLGRGTTGKDIERAAQVMIGAYRAVKNQE